MSAAFVRNTVILLATVSAIAITTAPAVAKNPKFPGMGQHHSGLVARSAVRHPVKLAHTKLKATHAGLSRRKDKDRVAHAAKDADHKNAAACGPQCDGKTAGRDNGDHTQAQNRDDWNSPLAAPALPPVNVAGWQVRPAPNYPLAPSMPNAGQQDHPHTVSRPADPDTAPAPQESTPSAANTDAASGDQSDQSVPSDQDTLRMRRELAQQRYYESLPPEERPSYMPPVSLSTAPVEEPKQSTGGLTISRGLRDFLDDFEKVDKMLAQARQDGDYRAIFQLEGMQAELGYIIYLYTSEGSHAVNNYLADQARQVLYHMIKITADSGNLAIAATSTAVNNALPEGTNAPPPTRLYRTPKQVRAMIDALKARAGGQNGATSATSAMTPPRTARNPELMQGGERPALSGRNPELSQGGVRPALPVSTEGKATASAVRPAAPVVVEEFLPGDDTAVPTFRRADGTPSNVPKLQLGRAGQVTLGGRTDGEGIMGPEAPSQNEVFADAINDQAQLMVDGKFPWDNVPKGEKIKIVNNVVYQGHHRLIAARLASRVTGRPVIGPPGVNPIIPADQIELVQTSAETNRTPGSWRTVSVSPGTKGNGIANQIDKDDQWLRDAFPLDDGQKK